MTPEQLKSICQSVFGLGWQSKLARHLSVDSRTVRRWVAGDREIPNWAALIVSQMEGKCADRFIIGESPGRERRYLIHTHYPRFIWDTDDEDDHDLIHKFTWIDPKPKFDAELTEVFKLARDAVMEYSELK